MAEHPVSVLPPRGPAAGLGLYPGHRTHLRHTSRVPLVSVDAAAALFAVLVVSRIPGHLLLVAALLLCALWPLRRGTGHGGLTVPGLLDELPWLCGRIAVGWAGYTVLSLNSVFPLHTAATGFAVHCALAGAGRAAVYHHRRQALRRKPRAALLIGPGAMSRRVGAALLRDPGCGVRPVGIITNTPGPRTDDADGPSLPVLTTGEEARRAIVQNGVEVLLAVGPSAPVQDTSLLAMLAGHECAAWGLSPESPSYAPGDSREYLAGFACRPLPPGPRRRLARAGKRALDLVLSAALLLLVSPVLLVCAAVLRLTEGPGVVFRQERVGKEGRPFTMMKFRTHRPATVHESATRWSVADQQDMGRFCQFLRRTSLDELLQLWNVFRGDMSLVGPRPERMYFVTQFSQEYPGYAARHRMQTGITGLAQIQGLRGDTSIEDRARYDNAYIDNWSLWQDICILARTASLFIRPTGS